MSFDKILTELEQGAISVDQAKKLTLELLEDTKANCASSNRNDKGWYECGLDCAIIRLNLKAYEPCVTE